MPREQFASEGFAIVPRVLSAQDCKSLTRLISPPATSPAGSRSLLAEAWCASLARRLRSHSLLASFIPTTYVAVQCIYFEKSTSHNWLVPLHQDLSIPVAQRIPGSALQGWSKKEGSQYVQAPTELLEQLVAVRVHLDRCAPEDGPLRVIRASHTLGRISPETTPSLRATIHETVCHDERGDALIMRPLLLHASSKSTGASMRRVLHFMFGPKTLPLGLSWSHTI